MERRADLRIGSPPTLMTESDHTDEELVLHTRDGDEQSFELLMRRHTEAIRRLIARYFRDRSIVDDLAQETFVRAYFKLHSFRKESPFLYWLKKIAVRICLDEMRYRKTRGINRIDAAEKTSPEPVSDHPAIRIEAQLVLDKLLAQLDPLDRMIVVLLYGEGYEAHDVAGLTGLSRTNVKVRAFRLRKRLKMLYKGDSE